MNGVVARIGWLVPLAGWGRRTAAILTRDCPHAVQGQRRGEDESGNFLRHQDRAGALNFWKSLEVCRTVRVGFRRP